MVALVEGCGGGKSFLLHIAIGSDEICMLSARHLKYKFLPICIIVSFLVQLRGDTALGASCGGILFGLIHFQLPINIIEFE
jgi:hypothetical protein